jgi:hypothetical protein
LILGGTVTIAPSVAAVPSLPVYPGNDTCAAPTLALTNRIESRSLARGVRLSVYAVRQPQATGSTPDRAFVSVVRVRPGSATVQPASTGIPRLIHPSQPLREPRVVASMSGDYFEAMRQGDAVPQGALIVDGQAAFVPHSGSRVVAFDGEGRLRNTRIEVRGQVVSTSGAVIRPGAINDPLAPGDVTVAFTTTWSRSRVPEGRMGIVIQDDTVVKIVPADRSVAVPERGIVLWLGSDVSAEGFDVGARVDVSIEHRARDGRDVVHASGHGGAFLADGKVVQACGAYESILRPRTMLAWDDTGTTWLITASTRLPDPADGVRRGGATKTQVAQVAKSLGATHAVALDGGGSTSLFARVAGRATRIDLPDKAWARPLPVVWTVRSERRG